jgi:hypothetical protein
MGMKVGCLTDSQICLEEYEPVDPEPSPPQPDVPEFEACETTDDCMGLVEPKHICCVYQHDFTSAGISLSTLGIGCVPEEDKKCMEEFEFIG